MEIKRIEKIGKKTVMIVPSKEIAPVMMATRIDVSTVSPPNLSVPFLDIIENDVAFSPVFVVRLPIIHKFGVQITGYMAVWMG